jgi:hypothetical protein
MELHLRTESHTVYFNKILLVHVLRNHYFISVLLYWLPSNKHIHLSSLAEAKKQFQCPPSFFGSFVFRAMIYLNTK